MKKTITLFSLLLLSVTMFAQYTAIPDANFENALAAYDDIPGDGQVPTANIEVVTILSVPNQNISDLTGIQDFTVLEELWAFSNQISSLDVTQNFQLKTIIFSGNQLTNLDVSANTLLEFLNISNNLFTTTINLSQNLLLKDFRCLNNEITTLDVSQNTLLEYLSCENNEISVLDITQNTALTIVRCYINNISIIDISQCVLLEELHVGINPIASLDVSNNTALIKIDASAMSNLVELDMRNGNNQNITVDGFRTVTCPNLTCVSVDDVAYSNATWTSIDPQTSFNVDCSLSNEDFNLSSFSIYPNPTINSFTVASNVLITQVVIFDNLGREVARYQGQDSYSVSHLNAGIYFVSIVSENNNQIKKLVVN